MNIMRLNSVIRISLCGGLIILFIPFWVAAQNDDSAGQKLATSSSEYKPFLFLGRINANDINIRSDSTVSSKVICVLGKDEPVEVIKESYEWYKIRLPKTAASFIRKDFVEPIDEKTAKVIKDNVNIRLGPDESSSILGKAGKNEIINILGEKGEWYEIEPLSNSFGWVHKRFVDKATGHRAMVCPPIGKATMQGTGKKINLSQQFKNDSKITDKESTAGEEIVSIDGVVKPYGKVFGRTASHKLIALDNNVFLLKGNKVSLDSLNYHKVKITGKSTHPKGEKYTVIEIQKIEALD